MNDELPENFIKVVSNATFVYVDDQQGQAHQNINLSLNIEMEEIGGNGSGLEFENIPEEEEDEVLIPNTKKQRGKNKT